MNTSFTLVSPFGGHESWEEMMQLVTHKKFKGGHLMPSGKGTWSWEQKDTSSCPATRQPTTDDYEPFKKGGGAR